MALETLTVERLRNIDHCRLDLSPGLNVIVGPNASGKTSLLEAIALLCQGRSFRTARLDQLVQHGHSGFLLVATLRSRNRHHTLGMARVDKKTQVKLDGSPLARSTDLIELQPLHVITPESHEILDQGPRMRRQYLDWGAFHVKHDYLDHWQRYHRVLRQRNHALRGGERRPAIQAWDKPLVEEARQLHRQRQAYLDSLSPHLKYYGQNLLDLEVEYRYRPGWSSEYEDLAEQLVHDLEKDRERGFTHSGPQRADISVRAAGHRVQEIFSRGQQKLLICAMYLAQVALAPDSGILLIDDLPAELDPVRRSRLLASGAETGAQVFITATESSLIPDSGWTQKKLFHVEHGQIHEVV